MTWMSLKATAVLVLALGLAAPLEAQGRRDTGRDDDRVTSRTSERQGERDDRNERDDRDDRDGWYDGDDRDERDGPQARRRRNERGNGPSFCRSGAGHPVFGWDWCRERGWDRSANVPVRWERRTWEDVIFRRTDRNGSLDRRDLGDVLGSVILGRIDTRRRELGTRDDYVGRWATSSRGRELWITAGGVPLARLLDSNGDRRVDRIYLAER